MLVLLSFVCVVRCCVDRFLLLLIGHTPRHCTLSHAAATHTDQLTHNDTQTQATQSASASAASASNKVRSLPSRLIEAPGRTLRVSRNLVERFRQQVHAPTESDSESDSNHQLAEQILDATPLPSVLADLIAESRLHFYLPIWVCPYIGHRHGDSSPFDASCQPSTRAAITRGWSIRQIIGWGDQYCNGVQFVFGPNESADGDDGDDETDLDGVSGYCTTEKKFGDHHSPTRTFMRLRADEFIHSVSFRIGEWADSLLFTTNLDRKFRIGWSRGGGEPAVYRAPPGAALIGMTGLVGGHIHAIAPIFASIEPRRPASVEEDEDDDAANDDAADGGARDSNDWNDWWFPSSDSARDDGDDDGDEYDAGDYDAGDYDDVDNGGEFDDYHSDE